MARLTEIVIDAADPPRLARFWAAALDEFELRPYDDAELERLAALGLTPATDPSVAVDGPVVTLFFKRIDGTPRGDKRGDALHLDLGAADVASEHERLLRLGATLIAERDDHLVLADPEGNRFCLFRAADRR